MQSVRVTEEIRYALLLAPGDLLHFHQYEQPLLPNKALLYRGVVDTKNAEQYLRRGFALNPNYRMAESLRNTIEQMLPNMSQVISLLRARGILTAAAHQTVHRGPEPVRDGPCHHRGYPRDPGERQRVRLPDLQRVASPLL